MKDLDKRVSGAVRFFWETRAHQKNKQDTSGKKDQGSRGAVTGGKQLDGFVNLISDLVMASGVPEESIFRKSKLDLPGFFRPEKRWDLLVVHKGNLLAVIEFKAQVGPSFGNNFNNRTEEAIGNATDIWTAYREGAFKISPRPWLGYLMLLEEAPGSTCPVSCKENHFPVFEEFKEASYAKRYEIFCTKLVRERLYDSSCLILSSRVSGLKGQYHEPLEFLGFRNLITSLFKQLKS